MTGAGTLGSDVRNDLGSAPYGWPDDAVNAALVVLLAEGHVRAESDAKPIGGPKELPKTQIGKAKFFKESGTPPTVEERLALGGLLVKAKVQYEKGREAAASAGCCKSSPIWRVRPAVKRHLLPHRYLHRAASPVVGRQRTVSSDRRIQKGARSIN